MSYISKEQSCEKESSSKGTHVVFKKKKGAGLEKEGCTNDPEAYKKALYVNAPEANEEIEIVEDELTELSSAGGGSAQVSAKKDEEQFLKREDIWKQIEEEQKLRETIRRMALLEQRGKQKQINEDKKLRKIIRKIVLREASADTEDAPHASTGINVLKNVLKKIVPIIQIDYKLMTTDPEQRVSYRKHLVRGMQDAILSSEVVHDAEPSAGKYADIQEDSVEEDLEIEIGSEEEKDVAELSDTGYIELGAKKEKVSGIEGEDKTGRDMAADTLERVEKTILSAFEKLHEDSDQEDFKRYLSINILLHMDRFEDALTALADFEVPGYEEEKTEAESEEAPEAEEEAEA